MKKRIALIWLLLVLCGLFGLMEYEIWTYGGILGGLGLHGLAAGVTMTVWSIDHVG